MREEGTRDVGVAVLGYRGRERSQRFEHADAGRAGACADLEDAQPRVGFGAQALLDAARSQRRHHAIEVIDERILLVDVLDALQRRVREHDVGGFAPPGEDVGQRAQHRRDQVGVRSRALVAVVPDAGEIALHRRPVGVRGRAFEGELVVAERTHVPGPAQEGDGLAQPARVQRRLRELGFEGRERALSRPGAAEPGDLEEQAGGEDRVEFVRFLRTPGVRQGDLRRRIGHREPGRRRRGRDRHRFVLDDGQCRPAVRCCALEQTQLLERAAQRAFDERHRFRRLDRAFPDMHHATAVRRRSDDAHAAPIAPIDDPRGGQPLAPQPGRGGIDEHAAGGVAALARRRVEALQRGKEQDEIGGTIARQRGGQRSAGLDLRRQRLHESRFVDRHDAAVVQRQRRVDETVNDRMLRFDLLQRRFQIGAPPRIDAEIAHATAQPGEPANRVGDVVGHVASAEPDDVRAIVAKHIFGPCLAQAARTTEHDIDAAFDDPRAAVRRQHGRNQTSLVNPAFAKRDRAVLRIGRHLQHRLPQAVIDCAGLDIDVERVHRPVWVFLGEGTDETVHCGLSGIAAVRIAHGERLRRDHREAQWLCFVAFVQQRLGQTETAQNLHVRRFRNIRALRHPHHVRRSIGPDQRDRVVLRVIGIQLADLRIGTRRAQRRAQPRARADKQHATGFVRCGGSRQRSKAVPDRHQWNRSERQIGLGRLGALSGFGGFDGIDDRERVRRDRRRVDFRDIRGIRCRIGHHACAQSQDLHGDPAAVVADAHVEFAHMLGAARSFAHMHPGVLARRMQDPYAVDAEGQRLFQVHVVNAVSGQAHADRGLQCGIEQPRMQHEPPVAYRIVRKAKLPQREARAVRRIARARIHQRP